MRRTVFSSHPIVVSLALLLASCSGGRQFEASGGGPGGQTKTGMGGVGGGSTATGGHAGATGTGGFAGAGVLGSGGKGGVGGAATSTGGVGGAVTSTGGVGGAATSTGGVGGAATSTGGVTGTGGTTGTGGGPSCTSTQHMCGTTCDDNSSPQTCGTTSCSPCTGPSGATLTCTSGKCGYTCPASAPTNCPTQGICIASTGCCDNTGCPAMSNGKTGTCDATSHTCNYNCDPTTTKACTVGGTTTCLPLADCCANSDCTGTCVACDPTSHTCVAAKSEADPNGRCAGTCDSTGACKAKQGQICTTVSGGCISGTTCSADGYCCNSACGGSGACAGTCSTGTCVYPTVSCGSICSGTSSYIGPGSCSNGSCGAPAAQPCANHLVCSQNACVNACLTDTDCASGYFCEAASCHLAAVAVGAGSLHACALLSDGTVRCWGSDTYGELGNGMTSDSATPVAVLGMTSVKAIGAGLSTTCALRNDGTVWCWGFDGADQLGPATVPQGYSTTPIQVTPGLGSATALGMGLDHTCTLVGGQVECWGNNQNGALGNGTYTSAPSVATATGLTGVTTVASGRLHTCAGSGSSLWCWGDDSSGQLGNGQFITPTFGVGPPNTPQAVMFTAPATVRMVAAGGANSCALLNNGSTYCWGAAPVPGATSDADTPQAVTGLSSPTVITVGAGHVCAINGSGALMCWGDNSQGELGNGTLNQTSALVAVTGLPQPGTVIAVSAGVNFTCAVVKNGSVWCWGENDNGVLGTTGVQGSASPFEIPGW